MTFPSRQQLADISEILHAKLRDYCETYDIHYNYIPEMLSQAHVDAVIIEKNTIINMEEEKCSEL